MAVMSSMLVLIPKLCTDWKLINKDILRFVILEHQRNFGVKQTLIYIHKRQDVSIKQDTIANLYDIRHF